MYGCVKKKAWRGREQAKINENAKSAKDAKVTPRHPWRKLCVLCVFLCSLSVVERMNKPSVLVVDAPQKTLRRYGLKTVRVGFDECGCIGVVDGAALAVGVVLDFGAIERVVLHGLAHAVDVVHMSIEGGGAGFAALVGRGGLLA